MSVIFLQYFVQGVVYGLAIHGIIHIVS